VVSGLVVTVLGISVTLAVWRGKLFKSKYLPLVRPFSAVPELLPLAREEGLKIAVASSAKASELEVYLDIARITA
jgi:hypothetical protein